MTELPKQLQELAIRRVQRVEQFVESGGYFAVEVDPVFTFTPYTTLQAKANAVIDAVAMASGVIQEAMLGQRRGREVVTARHVAILLMAERHPRLSLLQLARLFSRADHTTIMHALKVTRERIDDNRYSHRAIYDRAKELLDR